MEIQKVRHGNYIVKNENVVIKFKNLYSDKNNISCTINAYQLFPERVNLLITSLNLMAPRSVSEVGRMLEKQDPSTEWSRVFPVLSAEILSNFLTPEEPAVLRPAERTTPSWLIENFVLSEAPTILFSPGGSGKSFLSLFLSLCVQNGVDFFGKVDRCKTLYLDWEVDQREAERRLGMIVRGMSDLYEIDEYPSYLRMYSPLVDCLDYVLDMAVEKGYRLLIIDSAACAVGGDMNDSAVVTRFFSAIRRINACGVTTFIISHVSKADKVNDTKKTPIGSVHFENFPRLAWELRSEYDATKHEFRLGLFCRKSNVGGIKPFGLRMEFDNDMVIISTADAETLEAISEKDSVTGAILGLLAEKPLTSKEIANELEIKPAVVYTLLARLKKLGKVTSTGYGSKWKLVQVREGEDVPF